MSRKWRRLLGLGETRVGFAWRHVVFASGVFEPQLAAGPGV